MKKIIYIHLTNLGSGLAAQTYENNKKNKSSTSDCESRFLLGSCICHSSKPLAHLRALQKHKRHSLSLPQICYEKNAITIRGLSWVWMQLRSLWALTPSPLPVIWFSVACLWAPRCKRINILDLENRFPYDVFLAT